MINTTLGHQDVINYIVEQNKRLKHSKKRIHLIEHFTRISQMAYVLRSMMPSKGHEPN